MVNSSFPSLNETLPHDAANALLIGRIWVPGEGPYLVKVGQHEITDLSELAMTSSDLMELEHAARSVAQHLGNHSPALDLPLTSHNHRRPVQRHPVLKRMQRGVRLEYGRRALRHWRKDEPGHRAGPR